MAAAEEKMPAEQMQGFSYLVRLQPLLERLHDEGCERDKAGNRNLHFDQLCSLILLTFFNPTVKTLGDLRKASKLQKVRQKLGCSQTSIGSLSEAMSLFDADRLGEIIQELLRQIPDAPHADPRLKELPHLPTAVDGSLLKKLPQITQACYQTRTDLGWKLHAHFEILSGVPTRAEVTDASGKGAANEKAVLRRSLESDRCYVMDRGYEQFELFNEIAAAMSSYVCRVRNDHHFEPDENAGAARELSAEAREAGILEDVVGRMGSPKSKRITHPDHRQRRIVVRVETHPKRGGRRRQAATHELVLVTNLLDVPAEIIVLLYRFRWLIELFFRWLKCVLACRHLISQKENGIQIQMYCALIACLLIQLATGRNVKPNQWTYKLLCLYVQGWATEEEVFEHLRERQAAAAAAHKN